jgi:hypothetical protein
MALQPEPKQDRVHRCLESVGWYAITMKSVAKLQSKDHTRIAACEFIALAVDCRPLVNPGRHLFLNPAFPDISSILFAEWQNIPLKSKCLWKSTEPLDKLTRSITTSSGTANSVKTRLSER